MDLLPFNRIPLPLPFVALGYIEHHWFGSMNLYAFYKKKNDLKKSFFFFFLI